MQVTYKVYERVSDKALIVSYSDVPTHQVWKRKYVGKKAKLEAIFRLKGVRLPNNYTTGQVNNFLSEELFNTPDWYKYRQLYNEVANEKEFVSEEYIFKYNLLVEFCDISLPVDDERIIYFVSAWLIGKAVSSYKGVSNPIVSCYKDE